MRKFACCTPLVAAAAGLVIVIAATATPQKTSKAKVKSQTDALASKTANFHDLVNESLGLGASELVQLNIAEQPGQGITKNLIIDGNAYTMNLDPISLRASGFKLLVQGEGGIIEQVDPGPEITLRGSLIEEPDSVVAGGHLDEGLYAMVFMPDGNRWALEPLLGRVKGAQAEDYVLYNSSDVTAEAGICGNIDAWAKEAGGDFGGGVAGTGPACLVENLQCAEHLSDSDFRFYDRFGPSVTNVANRMNMIMNAVNVQYERDVCIRHLTTAITVRTDQASDPYDVTNNSSTLNAFLRQQAGLSGVPHDVGQLFSGSTGFQASTGGTVIGQASGIGTVCTNLRYCVCSSFSNDITCIWDLSAHELGHVWNSHHCGCPLTTMNAFTFACSNQFGAEARAQIIAHRESINCLDTCIERTTTLPFFDDFPDELIDPTKWSHVDSEPMLDGSAGGPLNVPSGSYALNLAGSPIGGDVIETATIPLEGGSEFILSYWYQRGGNGNAPEATDHLAFEFLNTAGSWSVVSFELGSGPVMTTFEQTSVELPFEALHENFRLRIRVLSNEGTLQEGLDDWFVDDVSLTYVPPPSNQECPDVLTAFEGSTPFSTVGAITSGPDEDPDCLFNGQSQTDHDVWFVYDSACGGDLTISLCDTDFDAKLAIYENSCPPSAYGPTDPTQVIACSDNACGTDPEVTFAGNPVKKVYLIRIGGVNSEWGTGNLLITCDAGCSCQCSVNCPGDIDPQPGGNGAVDINDLRRVILDWGQTTCPSDINFDGIVNIVDLRIVILNWGLCPGS